MKCLLRPFILKRLCHNPQNQYLPSFYKYLHSRKTKCLRTTTTAPYQYTTARFQWLYKNLINNKLFSINCNNTYFPLLVPYFQKGWRKNLQTLKSPPPCLLKQNKMGKFYQSFRKLTKVNGRQRRRQGNNIIRYKFVLRSYKRVSNIFLYLIFKRYILALI